MKKWMNKFKEMGSVNDKPRSRRRHISEEATAAVQESFERGPCKCHTISSSMNIEPTSIWTFRTAHSSSKTVLFATLLEVCESFWMFISQRSGSVDVDHLFWPPHFPDLSTLDIFFMWPGKKLLLTHQSPLLWRNKAGIINAINDVTKQQLENIFFRELENRIEKCITAKGSYV